MIDAAKPEISELSQARLRATGSNISLARRVRGLSQAEFAQSCSMGLSTLVAIEKGSLKVSMSHWVQALEALGLQDGLEHLGSLVGDATAMQALVELVPMRASVRMKRIKKPVEN